MRNSYVDQRQVLHDGKLNQNQSRSLGTPDAKIFELVTWYHVPNCFLQIFVHVQNTENCADYSSGIQQLAGLQLGVSLVQELRRKKRERKAKDTRIDEKYTLFRRQLSFNRRLFCFIFHLIV